MSDKVWYTGMGGQRQGPFGQEELAERFRSGELGDDTYVHGPGMSDWAAASSRPEFAATFGGSAAPPPTPPAAKAAADVIDYEVFGEEMQFVEITLDPREACISEAGAFMYMDPGIEMQTIFGDGSGQSEGTLFDKLLSAGKRVLTGESLFMTVFANSAGGRQKVAFASPYPGRIIAVDLQQHGNTLLCQKDAFLCAAKGVAIGIAFQKKLGAGLFGGEGFILQKLDGDGLAFLHAGGTVVERTLQAGETMRLDTGCLVAFEQGVNYDIQMIKGIKSVIFGGEGMFYAALTGPGKVWIQSLPFSRLAKRVYAAAPQTRGGRKGEGSVLGGLGDLMMGD
ncbi:MAG: TIGR00266 family protein [Thermoanaerobaculia bacterium]